MSNPPPFSPLTPEELARVEAVLAQPGGHFDPKDGTPTPRALAPVAPAQIASVTSIRRHGS